MGGASDQPVGGGVAQQVIEGSSISLGGDRQRAVLDERARVAQIGQVLPGRAVPVAVAAGNRLGTGFVEYERVPIQYLDQVGPQAEQRRRLRPGPLRPPGPRPLR